MIKVIPVDVMREVEAAADAAGVTYDQMMQNAGRAAADRALAVIAGLEEPKITVLVGPGNNGGDGLVAGRLIAEDSDAQVRFYLLKRRDDSDPNFKAAQDAGLFFAYAEDDKDHRVLRNMVASGDLLVDALFGIGVKLPIKDGAAKVLRSVNQAIAERRGEHPALTSVNPALPNQMVQMPFLHVIAVDCPSGLDCDTGELDANAIQANETVTFIAAKPGLLAFPGAAAVGELHVASIGVQADLEPLSSADTVLVDGDYATSLLPPRPADSNKGTFGKALVVAGSVNYVGAPGLASMAAYRSGAGLVTVAAPHPVVNALAGKQTETTWVLVPHDMGVISEQAVKVILEEVGKYDAMLLGPGWGREETTRTMLTALLDRSGDSPSGHNKRRIGFLGVSGADAETSENDEITTLPPLVVDADGLNLLSEVDEWWKLLPKDTVITPHPGEMGRLTKLEVAEIQANRLKIAQEKAKEWDIVVVLKGAHTVIAAPDGRIALLPFKTDALATAGTGDVLAGIIVGLRAQGLEAFEAAALGGYLHGLSGVFAAELSSRSVIAGDLIELLPDVFMLLEGLPNSAIEP